MLSFKFICSSCTYKNSSLPPHNLYVPTFGTENIAATFTLLCQKRKFFTEKEGLIAFAREISWWKIQGAIIIIELVFNMLSLESES